jgi:Spy/CpxP family protein refolding chaperone
MVQQHSAAAAAAGNAAAAAVAAAGQARPPLHSATPAQGQAGPQVVARGLTAQQLQLLQAQQRLVQAQHQARQQQVVQAQAQARQQAAAAVAAQQAQAQQVRTVVKLYTNCAALHVVLKQ